MSESSVSSDETQYFGEPFYWDPVCQPLGEGAVVPIEPVVVRREWEGGIIPLGGGARGPPGRQFSPDIESVPGEWVQEPVSTEIAYDVEGNYFGPDRSTEYEESELPSLPSAGIRPRIRPRPEEEEEESESRQDRDPSGRGSTVEQEEEEALVREQMMGDLVRAIERVQPHQMHNLGILERINAQIAQQERYRSELDETWRRNSDRMSPGEREDLRRHRDHIYWLLATLEGYQNAAIHIAQRDVRYLELLRQWMEDMRGPDVFTREELHHVQNTFITWQLSVGAMEQERGDNSGQY